MISIILIFLIFKFFYRLTVFGGFIYFWLSFLFMFLQVLFFTTCERKVLALAQRRVGPSFVGDRGRLQYFADALKILVKNYVGPRKINSLFFQGASVSAFWFSWYSFSNLTFNYGEDIADIDFNIFFSICCSSGFGLSVLVAGWSSISKYAMLGCVRASIQLISYEIIMGTIFLIFFIITGTTNFESIIDQEINFSILLAIPFVGVVFFLATLMETNRPPFDLSEAESDVVAGYTVEYGGVLFGLFYLGEYVNIFTNSFIISTLLVGCGFNIFNQIYVLIFNFYNFFYSYLFNSNLFISFFNYKAIFFNFISNYDPDDFITYPFMLFITVVTYFFVKNALLTCSWSFEDLKFHVNIFLEKYKVIPVILNYLKYFFNLFLNFFHYIYNSRFFIILNRFFYFIWKRLNFFLKKIIKKF